MITFFPKPYPDELLYSIIARYHVWSGNNEMSDTMEELFDYRRERATLFIPKHLYRLAEKTRKYGLDYETLLYEHTVFPFATCFLNKASLYKILDQEEKSYSIYKKDLNAKYLRYCPLCIRDDRNNYGEAYWHRKHQAYGMVMCDKHRCRLKDSVIEILDDRNNRYIALELLNNVTDISEQEGISECSIELQIAYDVDFIYKNYEFIRNLMWVKYDSIRETTIALLFRRGLANKRGSFKTSKIRQKIKNMYNLPQLKQLMEVLNDNPGSSDWLIYLCREGPSTAIPIRFILLAGFLAGSLESFIRIINEQKLLIDREEGVFRTPKGYEDKSALYRGRWLDALVKNPNGSRVDLRNANNQAYTWLRRYDNEWLFNNLPKKRNHRETSLFKDWAKIDNELESMVDEAVYYIKSLEGKPERITKANIRRYMRKKILVERNYKLLPRTMYRIEQYAENINDFRLRKIEWAKRELEKEGKPITSHVILQKSGIRPQDWSEFRHLLTS